MLVISLLGTLSVSSFGDLTFTVTSVLAIPETSPEMVFSRLRVIVSVALAREDAIATKPRIERAVSRCLRFIFNSSRECEIGCDGGFHSWSLGDCQAGARRHFTFCRFFAGP